MTHIDEKTTCECVHCFEEIPYRKGCGVIFCGGCDGSFKENELPDDKGSWWILPVRAVKL